MAALDIGDGVLGGVLSRWSVIHTTPTGLPAILAEFHRALASGGHLLIGFSVSDDASHLAQVFDHAVAPAYRWWPDHLAGLLRTSGLAEVARLVRELEPTDEREFKETSCSSARPDRRPPDARTREPPQSCEPRADALAVPA